MSTPPVTLHVEICLRCGAQMEWRHGTFQCPKCRFKIGCCEGETGDASSSIRIPQAARAGQKAAS